MLPNAIPESGKTAGMLLVFPLRSAPRRVSRHLLAEVIGKNRITVCVTVRRTQGLVCQPSAGSGRRRRSHVQEHAERLTAAEGENHSCLPPRWEIKNLTYSIFCNALTAQ